MEYLYQEIIKVIKSIKRVSYLQETKLIKAGKVIKENKQCTKLWNFSIIVSSAIHVVWS